MSRQSLRHRVWVGLCGALLGCGPAALEPLSFEDEAREGDEQSLAVSVNDHWFYGGPLPTLESARIYVSLEGHTARVSGLLPLGFTLTQVPPHARLRPDGSRMRLDAVYPIATARPGKSDSRPGDFRLNNVIPYRPDGIAVTEQEGKHMVPWGGFPFLRYNQGIALHGPITDMDNKDSPNLDVWYLQRGDVSGGCNRMMGEHVVELAHVAGISMRRVYGKNVQVTPAGAATVRVLTDYDQFEGKYIDSDFPTDAGLSHSTMTRPGKIYGVDRVEMFGSWVASLLPDGRDLPPDMKWEGGVSGEYYVFAEHAKSDWVCSVPPSHLARLKAYVERRGSDLPASFCRSAPCVLTALEAGRDPALDCRL